jgi:hypothetical protein
MQLRDAVGHRLAGEASSVKAERARGMTNGSESDAAPGELSAPSEPLGPKRGAFPSPKSEVEKAKPFIADIGDGDGGPEVKPDPTPDGGG